MNYFWNNFTSPLFDINVRVGQGSTLSPILSVFYLSPFLYILEKYLKNFKISISIISFIDNSLFISQSKSLHCSYNVMTNLFKKFGLIVEHSKTEVFYFNRSQGSLTPLLLTFHLLEKLSYNPKVHRNI